MSLLIQYGADVNARQENDENSLHSKTNFFYRLLSPKEKF
jgi:hypothetical protein